MKPIATAPRDGTWVRLYATSLGITSHPVRWCEFGSKGPGWYSAKSTRLSNGVFDCWLPAKNAAPAWCEALGVDRTASETEIRGAYRDLARSTHPDAGGSTEAMQRLNHARDQALAAISER